MKKMMMGCVTLFALSVAGIASAGEGQEYVTQDEKDGYTVKFIDDLLLDDSMGAEGAQIIVRPRAARITLIRPRTSFVNELLKTVENL